MRLRKALQRNVSWMSFQSRVDGRLRANPAFIALSSLESLVNYGLLKRPLPLWSSMDLEITSLCNRDCSFCPRHGDRSGVRKDAAGRVIHQQMPTRAFESIVDQAAELGYRGPVCLHRLSEPFLDPRYVALASYVRAKGMRLVENTNGDLLRNDLELCRAIDGLVDTLVVGLYDYRSEQEKRADMRFFLSRFSRTRVVFSFPLERCALRASSAFHGSERVKKDPRYLNLPCTQPLRKLLIRYDGAVSFCCEDDAGALPVGNAFQTPLRELWWSPQRVAMTRDLLRIGGRLKRAPCCHCFVPQTFSLLKF